MPPGVIRFTLFVTLLEFWPTFGFSQQASPALEEIQVLGDRLDYALDDAPAPALIYGKNHFLSFEPQGVGDMLKRTAGIAFSGDIGEFDAPQLRGLGPQYTQVLVNGARIPGNSADRSVLVDRMPAELIERIELIRSPTPNMDAQGIGGTLNLVLKDGADLQGTNWRLGGLFYPDLDTTTKGTGAITHGINGDNWRLMVSGSIQERLNPKTKREHIFSDDRDLLQTVNSRDLRDSIDKALRGTFTTELTDRRTLSLSVGYLDNQVDERERVEFLDGMHELDETALENRHTAQNRLELGLQLHQQLANGATLQLNLAGGRFDDDSREQEALLESDSELVTLRQSTATVDQELQLGGSLSWRPRRNHAMEVGAGVSREDRDTRQILLELEEDILLDTTPGSGSYRVEETRAHAYVMDTWNVAQTLTLEYGVRLEDTRLSQRGSSGSARESQLEVNPSAHLLYQVGDSGQFRTSLARTLRRPVFNEIVPFINRDTPDEDQVTVGNPQLQPESAWGLDIGYAHQFTGNRGRVGMNLFFRKIDDKVELTRLDDELFTPLNVGTGRTWGLELDFATTFSAIGLPRIGLFGNYAWIESRIDDPFTSRTRQFNLQPDYIANLDLYHDIPLLGLSHGISWQKQGSGSDFQTDEIKTVRYDANLEYFIEKRFFDDFIIRLTVNNILNAKKHEQGFLYQGLMDLKAGNFDEAVIETERAEPVFLLTFRGSF